MTKIKLFFVRTFVGTGLSVLVGAFFYLIFYLTSIQSPSEIIKYAIIISLAFAVLAIPLSLFSDIGLSKDERKLIQLEREQKRQIKLNERAARSNGCIAGLLTIIFYLFLFYLLIKLIKFFWYV